ncbi:hypothetical protein CIG75_04770 [Tumebacillus algifaecis]|uniref:Copper resistance protein D domain-containing protein n=1 Tax=Tumebacillus algifaecis TaxID=1214604 RepID=A0A223CYF7_9BACL|nr:hypothetical protein [Tumebacillus algifaecis]ASS74362.1 hypothetical protein CIG75_04770 [Tumebacillus algifaecis]
MTWFYVILGFHLLAVVIKLGVLFYIPALKNVAQIQSFHSKYKMIDRYANYSLWASGFGMVLVTSIQMLFQMWLLVSMLLYTLIFYIIKRVVMGRMEKIIATNKVHAHEEIRTLKVENYCVIIVSIGLFLAIGGLMMTKPF